MTTSSPLPTPERVGVPSPRTPLLLRRVLAVCLLASGIGLLASGLYIPAKALLAQVLIDRAWESARTGGVDTRPWPWADMQPVARLKVPSLDRSLVALSGASGESLAFGPAHVRSSAPPGARDNVVFAGHRDTHFAFLESLEVGDVVEVESREGAMRYRVEGTEVVHESRTELTERSGRAELTLITCYPFRAIVPGGPLRYVVHARMEPETSPREEPALVATPQRNGARG